MRLEGFSIEILVNGQPLTEYNLPIENSNSVTTDKSYVISNEYTKERKYSESTTYAAVYEPGSRFAVRYSSNKASLWNPMMAYVYVDGEYDFTYREILSSSFREKDCFWNNSLDRKFYFKFATTEMTDTYGLNQFTEQKTSRGLGAISIYFYKARIIPQKNVSIPPFSINQVQVSESKSNIGIKMTTAFDEEGGYVNRQPVSTMEKQSDDPIAVLHLHYRPVDWLRAHGFNVPHPISSPNSIREFPVIINGDNYDFNPIKDATENVTARVQPNSITAKYKGIRERIFQPVIVIQDDDEDLKSSTIINPSLFGATFNKRKLEDIEVILLDSDDENVKKDQESVTKKTRIEC